jgi:5-methylcytosine-specific restriction endonuclease McrA
LPLEIPLNGWRYSESDALFLQEVATQVALAIENMTAYEEIAGLKAKVEADKATGAMSFQKFRCLRFMIPIKGSKIQELDGFFDHDLNAWNNWNCWNLGHRCAHIMTNRYPKSSAKTAPYWIGRRISAFTSQ